MNHLIVNDEHQVIYCYVPKVACSNWKRVLIALSKNVDPLEVKKPHGRKVLKSLNKNSNLTEVYAKLRTYLKFVFVRNPLERLLSAYRSKFEIDSPWANYYRKRLGRKIIKNFRRNATKESLEKGHDVKFDEFLKYISNLSSKNHARAFDEHWKPISDLCFPCLIDYDVIGK